MKAFARLVAAAVLCFAGWVEAQPADPGLRVEPREQSQPTAEGLKKALPAKAKQGRRVRLERPSGDPADLVGSPRKGVPLKVGISREVAELADEASAAARLEWETLPGGGHVTSISITSEGAASVRAALRIVRVPDAAVLRFSAPGDAEGFEVSGEEVNGSVQRDAQAEGGNDRIYWSPVIDGDSIAIDIELPASASPREVRLAVPRVSHLMTFAGTTFATPTTLGRSAACNTDAMCSTGWSNQMNAVAQMIYSDSSGSYICTGTLLADADTATNYPYFLTARHCITSQTRASSLVTYWFYRSSACNSASPGAYQQLTGGGTLLYNSTTTDTAFLRLTNTPPQGTYHAGWFVGTTPATNTAITALHQPLGDLLKISQGRIAGYATCSAPTSGGFTCNSASSSSSTFYDVAWTSGITEGGSSGSGLFLGNGYLIGQLYGGSSSCGGTGGDVYGRFDTAYNAGMKNWLSPAMALTVAKSGTGSGTVTSSPAGISCGTTCNASFASGTSVSLTATPQAGSTFAGWSGACSGSGSCSVAMSTARSVTATFNQSLQALSVSTSGVGSVTSSPAGISCGSTCSASFAYGSSVTLTATPGAGRTFTGWSGACSGTGTCTVLMNTAKSVLATFGAPAVVDLSATQATAPVAPQAGKDVIVRATAINVGSATATGVVLTHTVPPGATFIWASPGCSHAAAKVTCGLGTLSGNASSGVVIVMRPAAAGTLTSKAVVESAESDSSAADNTSSLDIAVSASPPANIVQRYRLYSPVTQEHHFTTDANEYAVLGSYKGTWMQEGPAGKVLDNPGSYNGVAAVPYYRLYDNNTRWHHWTTDANEYYTLMQFTWWSAEGVDGYILPTQAPGTVPLFRLLYPFVAGLHHWTVDADEYQALVNQYGWIGEGGSGFVIP